MWRPRRGHALINFSFRNKKSKPSTPSGESVLGLLLLGRLGAVLGISAWSSVTARKVVVIVIDGYYAMSGLVSSNVFVEDSA